MRMLIVLAAVSAVGCAAGGAQKSPASSVAETTAASSATSPSAAVVSSATEAPSAKTSSSQAKRALPSNARRVVKNGEEYICQKDARTGSKMKLREVCMTPKEWEERAEQAQALTRELRRPLPDPQPQFGR